MNSRSFKVRSNITTFPINRFGDAPTGGEILTGLLSTVYKLDDSRIAEIMKDGRTPTEVLKDIADADKSRVAEITKRVGTDKYQDGYKKAKGESLTAAETALKEHYGIDSDKTGTALVEEIVLIKAKESGATGSEDDIKKTPTYQALEKRLTAEVKKVKDDSLAEVKKLQDGYKKDSVLSKVGKTALELAAGMNAIFSTNATVAETQRADFVRDLSAYEYDDTDPENILVSRDGKLLTDDHGNTLKYSDHVKNIAQKRFEFAANNGGSNAGNKTDPANPNPGSYPAGIKKPTNATELAAIMSDPKQKIADKRIVMDTYKAENQN